MTYSHPGFAAAVPVAISRDAFQALDWTSISGARFGLQRCIYCGYVFNRALLGHNNCPSCFDSDLGFGVDDLDF